MKKFISLITILTLSISSFTFAKEVDENTLALANKYLHQKDYYSAAKYIKKLAKQGNADSQYELSKLYYNGKGVKQSYSQALKWVQKAAKQGHSQAQRNLAIMYGSGTGVKVSQKKAEFWLKKAAKNGDKQAQEMCQNFGITY